MPEEIPDQTRRIPLEALTLHLFGGMDARLDGARLIGLHLREGERLLAYLILNHSEPLSYRTLAEKFWPAEARMNYDGHGEFPSTRQAIRSLRLEIGRAHV